MLNWRAYSVLSSAYMDHASILLQDWYGQDASNIVSEICGLVTVLSGTSVLHSTREPDLPTCTGILIIHKFLFKGLLHITFLTMEVAFQLQISQNIDRSHIWFIYSNASYCCFHTF